MPHRGPAVTSWRANVAGAGRDGRVVTTGSTASDGPAPACPQCAELRAEVARLRRELARVRQEKDALLRAAAVRDYERPPHYE